jgi:hypothetical protein
MGMERRLAAIFSTDVQGYSRLMGEDEAATVRTITASRELMAALIQEPVGGVVTVLRVADMRRADALETMSHKGGIVVGSFWRPT